MTAQTYEELQAENVQLRATLNGTVAQNQQLIAQNTALLAQLNASLAQNQQLSAQVSSLSNNLSQQASQISQLNNVVQQLVAQNNALLGQLNASLAQNAQLSAEVAALRPPIPRITALTSVPCLDGRGLVTVDAVGSVDPSGSPLQYRWLAPGAILHNATTGLATASLPPGVTDIALVVSKARTANVTTARITVTDDAPPVSTAHLTGTAGSGGWFVSPVEVRVDAADACGIAGTVMSLDGADPRRTDTLVVLGDGAHAVTFQATDLAGRVEPLRNVTVRIDRQAPEVTLVRPAPATVNLGERYALLPFTTPPVVVGDVPVDAHATDALSGIARVEFWVDDALRSVDATAPYGFLWASSEERPGLHVIDVVAYDAAGNRAIATRTVASVPTEAEGAFATLAAPCTDWLSDDLCAKVPTKGPAVEEVCARVLAPATCAGAVDVLGDCDRFLATQLCRVLQLTTGPATVAPLPRVTVAAPRLAPT